MHSFGGCVHSLTLFLSPHFAPPVYTTDDRARVRVRRWVCTTISVVCYASAVLCFSIVVVSVHTLCVPCMNAPLLLVFRSARQTRQLYCVLLSHTKIKVPIAKCSMCSQTEMSITLEVRFKQPALVPSWLHWCAHNKINKIITKYHAAAAPAAVVSTYKPIAVQNTDPFQCLQCCWMQFG